MLFYYKRAANNLVKYGVHDVRRVYMYYIVTKISELYVLSFHLHRAVPNIKNVPRGLKPSNEHSMRVAFHAIVPLDIWEWDDSSRIYIRFGHTKFGKWKHDAGPGEKYWYIGIVCMCVYVLYSMYCYLGNFCFY